MLTEERTRTDQSKVKKALVTAGIILLAILLSVGASILACKNLRPLSKTACLRMKSRRHTVMKELCRTGWLL